MLEGDGFDCYRDFQHIFSEMRWLIDIQKWFHMNMHEKKAADFTPANMGKLESALTITGGA